MGKRLDRLLGRNKKGERPTKARTFVFALNRHRFETYCYYSSTNERDPNVRFISTSSDPHSLRGFHLEPRDRIVVLENVELGHFYKQVREQVLIISGGWVDIDQREKVLY